MKRMLGYLGAALILAAALSACGGKYETVKGDPMKSKIYTLDNGLKVYMTVNKDAPRLQTLIAVRSGSRNDPSDNTGLAHYLEHIMFKGSEHFGTSDYAAEKPLLDEIERLFEVYKGTTDPAQRLAIYHQIDSVSYQASLIAIPNEYDKLMAAIGAQGTNAFTSNDVTCYTEDIPSNQIDNWARIQADRFKNLVIRGFHTELEAVYEEYNMYLNEDGENAMMAVDSVLFPSHPYGLQSTIGTSEHLKSPSITAIKKQKATYYVPNNVAICLSGDFDPDEMVAVIEKYFGDWEPNPDLPVFKIKEEAPITKPVEKEVYGTESEFVMLGWRYPGECSQESEMADIVGSLLQNGRAGILDLDITQQQRLLAVQAMPNTRVDWGEMLLVGYPKEGQTLQDVRDILLEEIAKLRRGDFDESLIDAVVANMKLRQMRSLENNRSRAMAFVNSFIAGHAWKDDVNLLKRLEKVRKADVVAWVEKYLGPENYVVAYKYQGPNPKNEKIVAPKITPIATNRDKVSPFLAEVQQTQVQPIEPVFVDFNRDMSRFEQQPLVEVLYKQNENNDIATLQFRYDFGAANDPALSLAFDYLSYLGTATRSAEEMALEEYKLACSHSFRVTADNLTYAVTGLSENLPKALELVEDLIVNAVADEEILEALKSDELRSRLMSKLNQSACNSALRNYLMFGPEYVKATALGTDALLALTSEELLSKVRNILTRQHTVLYYGPQSESQLKSMLSEYHDTPSELVPVTRSFSPRRLTPTAKVFIAPYDSRQFNYTQVSDRGETFSLEDLPAVNLFNEYFGSGMNTVVFQEMRESRALAYSAGALLSTPRFVDDSYLFYASIGSQNDKLRQAVDAFELIINDMPQSQASFEIAKQSMEARYRTSRTNGAAVLNSYLSARDLGLDEPAAKYVYEHLSAMTMDDLVNFQQQWIKDRTYIYGILGDRNGLDLNFLRTLGPVEFLTLEDIFGY
ncbi:MAG: insulinase family protein [Bacteroidales bacterium]|nr:insulinase family protein [Bacteroidales bacterium]